MKNNHYTVDYVRARVESAGRTLGLFPLGFGRPQGHRSGWPEVMREMVLIVTEEGPGKGVEVILPPPEIIRYRASIREHTELDEVIGWIQDYAIYCRKKNIRVGFVNVLWLGMRRHPMSGKQLRSWRRIGKDLGVDHKTANRWYDEGIERICVLQNEKIHSLLKI
jgi:hypothetical protein